MNTDAISIFGSPDSHAGQMPRHPALLADQASFTEVLGQASRRLESPAEMARRGAEQLVATAFIQPLLKSMRESNMAAPPFAPTTGEKQFRALADTRMAHDIVRSANLPIVERLTQDLLKRAGVPQDMRSSSKAANEPALEGVR